MPYVADTRMSTKLTSCLYLPSNAKIYLIFPYFIGDVFLSYIYIYIVFDGNYKQLVYYVTHSNNGMSSIKKSTLTSVSSMLTNIKRRAIRIKLSKYTWV